MDRRLGSASAVMRTLYWFEEGAEPEGKVLVPTPTYGVSDRQKEVVDRSSRNEFPSEVGFALSCRRVSNGVHLHFLTGFSVLMLEMNQHFVMCFSGFY